jgi:hypothetical protein
MASETQMLSSEEFVSLLLVGNTPVNGSGPAILIAHSVRLIALGYMADIEGRLRMTTPGRFRIHAGQIADAVTSRAWMKRQLLSLHPLNQFLDPINSLADL